MACDLLIPVFPCRMQHQLASKTTRFSFESLTSGEFYPCRSASPVPPLAQIEEMPQTQQFSEIPDFQSAWNTGGDVGHTEQEGAFVTDFPQDFGNDFVASGQDGQGFGTDWPDSAEGEREKGKKDKKEKKKKDKLGGSCL